jgi:ribonuclease P protein component
MLGRANRLTEGPQFAATIRRGRRAGSTTLVVHLWECGAPSEDEPRVGLVVGKAVGGAVSRNQVKRRLRHLVRGRLDELPRGTLLVIRALPPAAAASSAALDADLAAALRRVLGARAVS